MFSFEDFHNQVYTDFRILNIAEQKEEFTQEQLTCFRQLLFLIICHNSEKIPYTANIETIQMCAEFFYAALQQRGLSWKYQDFLIAGKFDNGRNFYHSYMLFEHILQNKSRINLCFILPYLCLYQPKYYALTETDIPRLERYAFTFWNHQRSSVTERVDLLYDFIDISEILRSVIQFTFSDKSSRSEYVVDRTYTVLKEIAVCWACAILNRSKFHADQYDDLVSSAFIEKVKHYRLIASKH